MLCLNAVSSAVGSIPLLTHRRALLSLLSAAISKQQARLYEGVVCARRRCVLPVVMFPFSPQPDLYRSAQKDDAVLHKLRDDFSELALQLGGQGELMENGKPRGGGKG